MQSVLDVGFLAHKWMPPYGVFSSSALLLDSLSLSQTLSCPPYPPGPGTYWLLLVAVKGPSFPCFAP